MSVPKMQFGQNRLKGKHPVVELLRLVRESFDKSVL